MKCLTSRTAAHIVYCKNYSTILREDRPFKATMLEIR